MLSFDQVTIEAAHYSWLGRRSWQPLLTDISLQLAPGEIVALVGGSGEGKSLLLQSALTLLPDNLRMRGSISLDGTPLCDASRARLRGHTLCYVPQGVSALNPLLTVERQLGRAARLCGQSGSRERLGEQLLRYQLPATTLDSYPRQLSGGMAKRILACTAALGGAATFWQTRSPPGSTRGWPVCCSVSCVNWPIRAAVSSGSPTIWRWRPALPIALWRSIRGK